MNYTEKYELRQIDGSRSYTVIDQYDREHEAVEDMETLARYESGVWHVVRVSEVIVSSRAKA